MTPKEVEEIEEVMADDYTQSVAKMSDSRIGGQIRSVQARLRSPTWSPEAAQEEAQQFVNGCLLKTATEYFESMEEDSMAKLAKHFKIEVDELTPYHLVTPVEAAILDALHQVSGAVTFAQYANQKGYEDLVTVIRSVGRKPKIHRKPSYLERVLTPQINAL